MTTEIVPISKITMALKEANITDQVLTGLKTHFSIKVKGPDDKEGYALARKARLQCKELRVLASKISKAGREGALMEQRAWIAEEKRITGQIEAVEAYLEGQEHIVDEAKERAEREKQEAEEKEKQEIERRAREKFEKRVNALMAVGVFKTLQEIATMIDSDFDKLLKESTEKHQQAIELKKKQDEETEKEKARLAEQKKEQDKKDAEQREAQRKIDEANRQIELSKAKEEARLRGIKEAEEKQKREAEEKKHREEKEKAELARLEALKPDKEKLVAFSKEIGAVRTPELSTEEGQEQLARASTLILEAIEILRE
jgi:hypothetical protein